MPLAAKVFSFGCAALACALTPPLARAQSDPADLKAMAVPINRTPHQPWPGYGIYLGAGLLLTAGARAVSAAAPTPPPADCPGGTGAKAASKSLSAAMRASLH